VLAVGVPERDYAVAVCQPARSEVDFSGRTARGHRSRAGRHPYGRAEWFELDLSALQVSGRGLAFLSGNTGVYMIDLVRGAAAPSRSEMTDQAHTVMGRLA